MTTIGYGLLHHQFRLFSAGSAPVAGWHCHPSGCYRLCVHPSLPVIEVSDKHGNRVGHVLGWPIDRAGRLIQREIQLPFEVGLGNAETLERTIYGFGGRYAFVIASGELQRLYLDAGGTLSVVFSKTRQRAGSTVTALALDEPDHPLWSRGLGEFPDNKPDQYWPAGTTVDPDTTRLLPNHYLDLTGWRSVRHHPTSAFRPIPERNLRDHVERVIGLLRGHISSVLESQNRVYMPLTAGHDSRMLLACARPWAARVEFVTFDYRPWRRKRGDHIDLYVAQRLAKRFGLRHSVIPIPPEMPVGTELRYLHQIGFACGSGKSRDFFWACREHLDMSAAWLTGFAGGIGRACFSRATDNDGRPMSPAALLTRLGLPTSATFQEAVRAWRDSLPDTTRSTLLGLAHLELRVGCWAAPHFHGAAPFSVNLDPFSHREIFDAMLGFPYAYRRSHALTGDILKLAWPELSQVPCNDYPGFRAAVTPRSWLQRTKHTAESVIWRMLRPN